MEIVERSEDEAPFEKKEKYAMFFQWKLGQSKMCEHVTVKGRSPRLFW